MTDFWLDTVGLGVTLWDGEYEGVHNRWLRWCERDGALVPTASETIRAAEDAIAAGHARASTAEQRAEAERQRAEALAARLRALGIDPDAA